MLKERYTSVLDVDGIEEFRKQDIDLILFSNNQDGNTVAIEIKADAFPIMKDGKKYIFLETVSNNKKGTKGCIYASSCNYFIFYYTVYDKYLIVNRNKLLYFISEHENELQHKTASTWSRDNKTLIYQSYGLLVDDDTLIKNNIAALYNSSQTYLSIKKELFGE